MNLLNENTVDGEFPPVTEMTLDTDNTLHGTWTMPDGMHSGQMFTVGKAVKIEPCIQFSFTQGEVLRIDKDGRIFWKGCEVEGDDEFKAAMLDLHSILSNSINRK